jgi:hypothetical protein
MLRIVKRAMFCAIFVTALLSAPLLDAQQLTDPPPAPVPAQIVAGKRVFISNASGETNLRAGTADLNYRQFYASMKSWGRYELVSAPADADLIFEIRYEVISGAVHVDAGTGGSGEFPEIRLTILDPKTHVILWAFTEPVYQVRKKDTGLQNFQNAMNALMSDVKALAAPAGGAWSNN